MPFTLSHPAAVIPLRRLGVFSALVIGSMMPDTLYFLPFVTAHQPYGHTLPGLFSYCLPVGLLFLWLFHHLLKRPLITLFPREHQGRLFAASPNFHFAPFRRFGLIVLSIVIGAATHILWDSVTHTESYVFSPWSVLSEPVRTGIGLKLQVADVLQLVSSIVGLIFIAYCYRRWLKRMSAVVPPAKSLPNVGRIILFALFAASAAVPFTARLALDPDLWFHVKRRALISSGIVNGLKVVCVELFVFCVLWQLVFREREWATSPASHSC